MCLYPRLIANPKYKTNKKNGGNIPPIRDPRVTQVPIGCGQCIECRKQKTREWQVRLLEEIKHKTNALFVTLTFSNESIYELQKTYNEKGYALDNHIATIATRRFLERWRKHYKRSLHHWLITELGHNGTNNIHLHGILWFQSKKDINNLESTWRYGYVFKGKYVNQTTIAYIVKYVSKIDKEHPNYKPKILTSPGIGKQYIHRKDKTLNEFNYEKTKETYTTQTGHKIALPSYYRNKIYTDEEKEILWLQKLDKAIIYVLKAEIDISKNHTEYLNALKNARRINAELGYGNIITRTYEQKEYENNLRIQMQNTRINNAKNKIIERIIKKGAPEAPF